MERSVVARMGLRIAAHLPWLFLVLYCAAAVVSEHEHIEVYDTRAEMGHAHDKLPSEDYYRTVAGRLSALLNDAYPEHVARDLSSASRAQSLAMLLLLWATPALAGWLWLFVSHRSMDARTRLIRPLLHWSGAAVFAGAAGFGVELWIGSSDWVAALARGSRFSLALMLVGYCYLAMFTAIRQRAPERRWVRAALAVGSLWLMFTLRQIFRAANSDLQYVFPAGVDRYLLSPAGTEVLVGLLACTLWTLAFAYVARSSNQRWGLGSMAIAAPAPQPVNRSQR